MDAMAPSDGNASLNVFVSYSHDDAELVGDDLTALSEHGFRVWFDDQIGPGKRWRKEIADAIDACDVFLFFVSNQSVRSENCLQELDYAMDTHRRLLPVHIERTDVPNDLQFSMGNVQAILRHALARDAYVAKLIAGARGDITQHARSQARPSKRARLVATVGLVALVIALVIATNRFAPIEIDVALDERSIAVMRFLNMGGDDRFADGLGERLLHLLARITELIVPSRTSSWSLSEQDLDPRMIATRLHVRYVLEGSVQQNSNLIRVTAQLIDGRTGKHVWSEEYDHELTAANFFQIQDQIAAAVVDRLQVTLSAAAQAQLEKIPTRDADALNAYLEGRAWLREVKSVTTLDRAAAAYERAILIDRNYAEAHAGLCETHLARYVLQRDASYYQTARGACLKALELDDTLGEVFAALGELHFYAGSYDEAEVELVKARELLPHTVAILEVLGRTQRGLGDLDAARAYFEEAIRTDPGNWSVYKSYGNFLGRTGSFDEAAAQFRQALVLDQDNALMMNNLASALYFSGQFVAATELWVRSLDDSPTHLTQVNYANALYYQGEYEGSIEMYEKAVTLGSADYRTWGSLAASREMASGDRSLALSDYERAIALARETVRVNAKDTGALTALALYYARTGKAELARVTLEEAENTGWKNPNNSFFAALTLLELGDEQACFSEVRKALALGYPPALLAADPKLGQLEGMDALLNRPENQRLENADA